MGQDPKVCARADPGVLGARGDFEEGEEGARVWRKGGVVCCGGVGGWMILGRERDERR